jgi:ABC-type sugar transport system substrate-binding protein
MTILLLSTYFPALGQGKSIKIVFLNPGNPNENSTGDFWLNVTRFMEAAANDLNIELVTIYAHRNHILMKKQGQEILKHKPNYVILVNEKASALRLIKQITEHDIPVFMLLNTLDKKDVALLSDKERTLLCGSLIPNNYIAGKSLLNGLVQTYESQPDKLDTKIQLNLLALQGDYNTQASRAREQGLSDALKNYKQLTYVDSSVANWSKDQAYQKVKGILKRTRVNIIWAANDAMAFGAKKAVMELKQPYPIIIGGVNWDIDDPHYPINLSFGGHVSLGAMALVMIKDINDDRLPSNERHQIIDIFESNLSPSYKPFIKRLHENKLDNYNFLKFSHASTNKLLYTIENLDKVFSAPIKK